MTKAKGKKKSFSFLFMVILIIAGLFDLKYKGLFYQLLPEEIQASIDRYM